MIDGPPLVSDNWVTSQTTTIKTEAKMLLSGDEIHQRLGNGLLIEPFDPERLNPNSYNLSLHDELLVYEEVVLDAAAPNRYRRIDIPPEGLTLQPNQLYLGRTAEHTETHGLAPMIQGRSSLGRLGLIINPGGSVGDVGYCGTWTLELHCVQPVRIYPGMQICQIYYLQVIGKCDEYCSDKYQNSRDIQPSQLYRELGGDAGDVQLELKFDELLHAAR